MHPLSSTLARLRRGYKTWRLRRRRARTARRKTTTGRALTFGLAALLVLLGAAYAWALDYTAPRSEGIELSLDELSALAAEKRLETAEFRDEDNRLVGTFTAEPIVERNHRERDGGDGGGARGKGADGKNRDERAGGTGADGEEPSKAPEGEGRYWVTYPSSDAAFGVLSGMATEAGARVTVDPQTPKAMARIVSSYLLPLLILATFFGLVFSVGRGGGSGIGDVLTFGTIGKKRQKKNAAGRVGFDDVAGADEAVAELREVVDYLSDPERYEEIQAVPPKGVLLFGPPGCGKTLLAKAVAGEAGVPFFSVAGAEFVESLVGVGAARVRDLFQRVRAVAPAIVFIDELDAAGRRRGYGGTGGGGTDEREQTLNQLLVEMDGFEVSAGIVVIGATNRPDIIDPALVRPGRFDRHITVDQPDLTGRRQILELHARGKPIAETVDFEYLAKRTPGFSGADLANVINEAALLSLRESKEEIETAELEEAIQRVLHGPQRRGRVLTPEERRRAAYHESGHAVVATALGRAEDVHRVTILARARGLGLTGIQRDSDALLLTRNQLASKLITAMGGLVAEELVLGEPSTGAEQDLEAATELARDMVGRFGMSPALGRARLLASDVDQYLGTESALSQLSTEIHGQMDAEVRRLLREAEQEALRLLQANRDALDAMAHEVEQRETLEGVELYRALRAVRVEPSVGDRLFNGHRPAARSARPRGRTTGASKPRSG